MYTEPAQSEEQYIGNAHTLLLSSRFCQVDGKAILVQTGNQVQLPSLGIDTPSLRFAGIVSAIVPLAMGDEKTESGPPPQKALDKLIVCRDWPSRTVA